MFNVGGGELLVILLVALIVLGPSRLPDAARQVGRVMGDVRRISNGFQQELKTAFDTAEDDKTRRTEPVPLAKAVADEDAKAAQRPAAGEPADAPPGDADAADGADTSEPRPLRQVESPAADGSSVAPAVADALDEIVAPPSAPAEADASPPGDEGLGGERAAS
jgi:sec-independent protein translocase protein TatB